MAYIYPVIRCEGNEIALTEVHARGWSSGGARGAMAPPPAGTKCHPNLGNIPPFAPKCPTNLAKCPRFVTKVPRFRSGTAPNAPFRGQIFKNFTRMLIRWPNMHGWCALWSCWPSQLRFSGSAPVMRYKYFEGSALESSLPKISIFSSSYRDAMIMCGKRAIFATWTLYVCTCETQEIYNKPQNAVNAQGFKWYLYLPYACADRACVETLSCSYSLDTCMVSCERGIPCVRGTRPCPRTPVHMLDTLGQLSGTQPSRMASN